MTTEPYKKEPMTLCYADHFGSAWEHTVLQQQGSL